MAESLLERDATRSHRILVLEAGPFVLPEHVQNLPYLGGVPDFRRPWTYDPALEPTYQFPGLMYAVGGRSLAWGGWSPEPLHDANNDEMTSWPPSVITDLQASHFLDAGDELGVTATNDFIYGQLHEALRRQLLDGLTATGAPAGVVLAVLPEHPVVRSFWRDNPAADPTVEPDAAQLREWLKLDPTDTTPRDELLKLLRLEAPLAVQSVTEPGLFPLNKFSAVPSLTRSARVASVEADGTGPVADARKRIMVVPNCHIQELLTETQADNWVRVVGVRGLDRFGNTVEFRLAPPRSDGRQSSVIVALGTIESTRLALWTFKDSLAGRGAQRMGENLIAHLRSNLTIRIPRSALAHLPAGTQNALQASALFVKGKAAVGGKDQYFHVQITASGLSNRGADSEAELFKKIPDIDFVEAMMQATDTTVVLTLRGIGEMSPMNPDSRVGLATTPGDVDFGRPAAYALIGDAQAPSGGSPATQADRALWEKMDDFIDALALIFANGKAFEILTNRLQTTIPVQAGASTADLKAMRTQDNGRLERDRRDALGTTHHEAGTLRMSVNPADGVTNEFGRIHDTTNCYVAGPALCPSTGSPNPMLVGVAMVRRTADLLTASVLPRRAKYTADQNFELLFDGTATSFNRWSRVSPGASNGFALIDGELVTYGGRDFGLLYYAAKAFGANFTLRAQFRIFDATNHNSGIFVRFRDPLLDLPPAILNRIQNEANQFRPDLSTDWQNFSRNRAWGAVHSGFEIQIDDTAQADPRRGFYGIPEPPGLNKNRTGAIYKIPAKDFVSHLGIFDAEVQVYERPPDLNPGTLYEFEIDVQGNKYAVDLINTESGAKTRTSVFTNSDAVRGVATVSGQPASFIGLQSYPGAQVAFRRIEVKV